MSVRSLHAVQPVHAMNAEQRQTAADPWPKPTDLSNINVHDIKCYANVQATMPHCLWLSIT